MCQWLWLCGIYLSLIYPWPITILNAFNSGCKYVILEAPTGFGKSPVAIAVALTLGSSYICTATKDLQTQYSNDFPYLKVAKGKTTFLV
jgi:ATP-dependent DNA helicase DinG